MKLSGNTLKEIIARDLLTIEKDTGNQTFIWNGKELLCHPTEFIYENQKGTNGNPVLKDGSLFVRLNQFTNGIPKSQDLVNYTDIYGPTQFKVARVKPDPSKTFLVIVLESDSKH